MENPAGNSKRPVTTPPYVIPDWREGLLIRGGAAV